MAAGQRDITVYQGDTYVHEIRIQNSSNTAININSRTYTGQIRKRRSSDDISAIFTTNIIDAANGVVVFSLSTSDTASLRSGGYVYDFQETNSGIVTTLLTGNLTVVGEVTR